MGRGAPAALPGPAPARQHVLRPAPFPGGARSRVSERRRADSSMSPRQAGIVDQRRPRPGRRRRRPRRRRQDRPLRGQRHDGQLLFPQPGRVPLHRGGPRVGPGDQRRRRLPGRNGHRLRRLRRRRLASIWPSPTSTASRPRSTTIWAAASSATGQPRRGSPRRPISCWVSAWPLLTPTTTASSTWPRPTATPTTIFRRRPTPCPRSSSLATARASLRDVSVEGRRTVDDASPGARTGHRRLRQRRPRSTS